MQVPVCNKHLNLLSAFLLKFLFNVCTLISSVQSLSRVRLFVTPWTAARQGSLFITNSQSLLKLVSIELVMQSNDLILCHPILPPPSIFPSIRVFSFSFFFHNLFFFIFIFLNFFYFLNFKIFNSYMRFQT